MSDTKKTAKTRGPRRPFPRHTIEEALKIAIAIQSNNNGNPWKPMYVAEATNYSPDSSYFRNLLSSSLNYGLTQGSYKAETIKLTSLGIKITQPRTPEEKASGLVEAVMKIEIFKTIYEHYEDGVFPAKDSFFRNMLERDFDVPTKWVDEAIEILESNGRYVGIIREVAGKPRVVFDLPPVTGEDDIEEDEEEEEDDDEYEEDADDVAGPSTKEPRERRIFIAHGKNKKPLDQLKNILSTYNVPFVVAIDEPHTGRPISKKVADLMNSCSSAVFIFTGDEETILPDGEKVYRPSDNVVYELGAASILYDSNIVIFKEEGVHFASDFSDLGYITFEKDRLDAKAMELFKELIGFGLLKITVA